MPHCANAAVLTDLLASVQALVEKMNTGCPPRRRRPACDADGAALEYILLRTVNPDNEVRLQKVGDYTWEDTPADVGHSEWRLVSYPPMSDAVQGAAILTVNPRSTGYTAWRAELGPQWGLQDLEWEQTCPAWPSSRHPETTPCG